MTSSTTTKWLALGVRPVDEPDRLGLLADAGLDLHAVAQQLIDVPVRLVQVVAGADRRSLAELVERAVIRLSS